MSGGPDAPGPAMEPPGPPPSFEAGGQLFEFAPDYRSDSSALELTPQEEDAQDRHRRARARPVLRWATREGLALFEGAPGRKHPLKDYYADGWAFRPWRGSGTALARIPPDLVVLDGDTDEGRSAIAAMNVPAHFAIRSLETGGEKHFFRFQDPPRRMLRALPGLDFLANPGNKFCWCKIDNGDGGYEIISESEDCPDLPGEVVAALAEAKASGAIIKNSGSRAGRTRQAAPGVRWDDDDELLPTGHYAEHGIPYGLQEDRFYRLADRFAAQGVSLGKGVRQLLDIAMKSEQDDRDPWTKEQLKEKMTRAIAWVATLPPEKSDGGNDAGAAITDYTLARRFATEVLPGRYCWVKEWGWMEHRAAKGAERRGARWFRTTDKEMADRAGEWVLEKYQVALDGDPKPSAAEVKRWEQQLTGYHLSQVASLAAACVKRDIAGFDVHRDLLNCANGVLDLRTGTLMDHDPALLFTKSTGTDYVPGAAHADWDRALTALPADVLPWVRIRVGQGASGHMPPDDLVLVMYGGGRNGKTSFLMGLAHALGGYYVQMPPEALFGDHSQHPTVRMIFRGARIAGLEETPDEGRLNSQQVKMLTSPRNTGRLMHQDYDPEGYATTHMSVVDTNHEPAVEATDDGTWRRQALVKWPYRHLPPGQRKVLPTDREGDPGLRDRIIAGATGQHEAVLAWLAEGARQWYEADRVMPPLPARVQADTDAWRSRANLISEFLPGHLEANTVDCAVEQCVMSIELYQVFARTIRDKGNKTWSERTFNQRLRDYADACGWIVEKKYTKHRKDRLSQPGDFPVDPPKSYQAWFGLRFRAQAADQEEPGDYPT